MKRLLIVGALALLTLNACEGWPISSTTYNPPTLLPSRTPFIQTVTPFIVTATAGTTASPTTTVSETPATASAATTELTSTPTTTITPTLTSTATMPAQAVQASVLGCDTSIDLTHGMGEVTNTYVTISNPTANDVNDLCATLSALDEGRPHPDKTKCLPTLASGYQVALKLTVDSTYQQQTPIQIDITSGEDLLLRVGEPACKAIGILMPGLDDLGIPKPIP